MVQLVTYTTANRSGLTPSAGLSVYDTDTNYVYFNDGTNDNQLVFINSSNRVGINTSAPDATLEINDATAPTIRLTYNDSDGTATNYSDLSVSATGDLTITASGGDIFNATNTSFDIATDGSTYGLKIGTTLVTSDATELNILDGATVTTAELNILDGVTATASEINYLDLTTGAGTAEADKALVLDSSSNITGINTLTANTISATNINISGVVSSLGDGKIKIQSFSGIDMNGRVVQEETVTDIDLTDYNPASLTDNYSIRIIGYIKPLYTETYTFHITTTDDKVRLWVDNTILYSKWDTTSASDVSSNTIALIANQWYPILIDQVDISLTQRLLIQWSSTSQTKANIVSTSLAFDSIKPSITKPLFIEDKIHFYSSDYTTENANIINNTRIQLNYSTQDLEYYAANGHKFTGSLNIHNHNGSIGGLALGGTPVTAIANEINYLDLTTGTGTAEATKAVVLNSSRNIVNINDIRTTGNLGINTSAPDKQVEINSVSGDCLRLTHNDSDGTASNYVDFTVDPSGNLTINSSGGTISTPIGEIFEVAGHNGIAAGLKLGVTLVTATGAELNILDGATVTTAELNILDGVTATAAEINYLDLTTGPGTAEATKALVLDGSSNIAGINQLTLTTLGVNTTAPDKQCEINSATGDCLRLTYNDSDGSATVYSDFNVSSGGDLTITPTGTTMNLTVDDASTNTSLDLFVLNRTSSGTAANGIGAKMVVNVENASGTNRQAGDLSFTLANATDAAEDGRIGFSVISAGTVIERAVLNSAGNFAAVTLSETSDVRKKENIIQADLLETYNNIKNINLVKYNFKDDETKREHTGVLAQELEQIMPNAVLTEYLDKPDKFGITDPKSVLTKELVGNLLGAVKILMKKVEDLEKQLK